MRSSASTVTAPVLGDRESVRRLLDRLAFGAPAPLRQRAVGRGFEATVRELLTPTPVDLDDAASPPPALFPVPTVDDSEPVRRDRANALRESHERILRHWWLDRISSAADPVTEKLTWFWHGHFATSEQKVNFPNLMLAQNRTLRAHARGSFRAMTHAVAVDPAMLFWLDGQENLAGAPNENLSRELMELFVLGVGSYAETDVREAARALTGWQVDLDTGTSAFDATDHDPGPETVLGTSGALDTPGLVDLLVDRPASAPFVAGRMWRRLVGDRPPSAATLDAMVAAYGPGTDITALLGALVASPEFRDPGSTLVKQPVEWAGGLMRALGVRFGVFDDDEVTNVVAQLEILGQLPFRPPNVGGWPSGPAWLTPASNLRRMSLALAVVARTDLRSAPTAGRATWVGELLGVDAWSRRTLRALDLVDDPSELVAVASCSPEYVIST
jgi:uncharacterized protein (DUF1800 family)